MQQKSVYVGLFCGKKIIHVVCVCPGLCSIFKGLFVFVYSKWIHFVKQINVIW